MRWRGWTRRPGWSISPPPATARSKPICTPCPWPAASRAASPSEPGHARGGARPRLPALCRYATIQPGQPPVVTLRSLADGSLLHDLHDQPDPRIDALQLAAAELVSLHNRARRHRCTGQSTARRPRFGPGPYPTIVSVYGGPHAQLVVNSWRMTAAMRAQYLRQPGFPGVRAG